MKRWFFVLSFILAAGAARAQFLEESFDAMPLGPISSQARWAGSTWFAATGYVNALPPIPTLSPPFGFIRMSRLRK